MKALLSLCNICPELRRAIQIAGCLLLLCLVFPSHGYGQRNKKKEKAEAVETRRTSKPVSAETQRRFDFVYLEALRLQSDNKITDAFNLFRYCEALDSTAAEVKYALAPFYFAMRMDSIAFAYLKEATRLEPDNYWFGSQLAELYTQKSRYKEAVTEYERLKAQFPKREEPIYQLLELYPLTDQTEKAITLLTGLEQEQGKSEEISMQKVRLLLYESKSDEAVREARSLAEAYPLELRYKNILADLLVSIGKEKEGKEIYRSVLAEDPTDEQARVGLINYYEIISDSTGYVSEVEKLLHDPSVSDETRGKILAHLIQAGKTSPIDSTRVLQLFDYVVETGIEDTDLLMLYAQYLLSRNLKAKATPVLERILADDPSNMLVRRQLLMDAITAQNLSHAIDLCIPLTKEAPQTNEDLIYHYYLTAVYYQQDRYEEALRTAQNALQHLPADTNPTLLSDIYAVSGDLFHQLKRDDEAYAAYDSSLVYNPLNIGTLNNYAYYLSIHPKGDLEKAEAMSRKTIEREPNNATYLDTYAWILFKQKRTEEARTYIDRAIEQDGEESPDLLDHAGDIYHALGLKKEAQAYWQKAIEKGISDPQKTERKLKR